MRHQKQIMAGADKGPIMLIEELQESNNMRQRLIDQQIKTIKELEESAGAKFYSMQRELSMMPEVSNFGALISQSNTDSEIYSVYRVVRGFPSSRLRR